MTLRGTWDEPRDGVLVSRHVPLIVRGWHLWDGRPVVAVAVEVAGQTFLARPGSDRRPDVAADLGHEGAGRGGWRVAVELPELPPGDVPGGLPGESGAVVIRVSVWAAPDHAPVVLGSRRIRLSEWLRPGDTAAGLLHGPPIDGALDLPAAGQTVERGSLAVTGWALGRDAPVERVEIVLDGESVGPAWLGMPRPDVAGLQPQAHALLSGFHRLVDLRGVSGDTEQVRLAVRAYLSGVEPVTLAERDLLLKDSAIEEPATSVEEPSVRIVDSTAAPLKLAVFAHDFDRGGAQLWLLEMLRQSAAGERFACTVVAPREGPLLDAVAALGVEVHISQQYPLRGIASYEGRVSELSAWLANGGYNAVLVNTVVPWIGADAAQRIGLPTVWVIHEGYSPALAWNHIAPGAFDEPVLAAFHRALRKTTAAVFVSNTTRHLYSEAIPPGRAVTVPYGVDVAATRSYCERVDVAAVRQRLGLPTKVRIFLSVGHVAAHKGQAVLALAFADVVDRYPDTHLVLVGNAETAYGGGIRSYFRRAGLADRTVMVPIADDVRPWFRAADLLVCPSYVESMPRTILEALAFGIPVAATDVAGIPEVVEDGANGFLFDPGDVVSARAALTRAAETDRARLKQMGEAGLHLAESSYGSADYAQEIVALIEGVRSKPDEPPSTWLKRNGQPR